MIRHRSLFWLGLLLGVATLAAGCGHPKGDPGGEDAGHGEAEAPSGASFKPGKGLTIREETSKIIGLELVEVTEEMLPQDVQLNVQIFVETHRLTDLHLDHTGCEFHGSGFVPPEKAALLQPQQAVTLQTSRGARLEGMVVAVQAPLVRGESEVIVGVTTAGTQLADGEFVKATVSVPRSHPVVVIPRSALLRTAEGTYVYTVNGDAYYRTAVTIGNSTDDKLEVSEGLYAGDQVVARPVETLWIIELRATKGGGHSH